LNATVRPRAALLLGPTGSGKTPLGAILEERGLWGTRCRHFDFGAQLRAIVQSNQPNAFLSRQDLDFLHEVLRTGALLENEHFAIAQRILRAFLEEPDAADATIVLNGLPRHVGQAEALAGLVEVAVVVQLVCMPDTVLERIRTDVGGDRAERRDDDRESVLRKLQIYAARTEPLVDHYRTRGARIETIEVGPEMPPERVWAALSERHL